MNHWRSTFKRSIGPWASLALGISLVGLTGCGRGGDDLGLGEGDILDYVVTPENLYLDFPDTFIGDTSPPRYLTLVNTGRLDLEFQVGEISSERFDFVGEGPGSVELEPGDELTVEITFTPGAVGIAQGTIEVTFEEPISIDPIFVALEGEGVSTEDLTPEITPPPVSVTPTPEEATSEPTPTADETPSIFPSPTPSEIDGFTPTAPPVGPPTDPPDGTPIPGTEPPTPSPDWEPYEDSDGDGVFNDEDCDDDNSAISPLSLESCDGIDEDCDGAIDEAFDGDGDGYPSCPAPGRDEDCDDTAGDVNPGEVEDWSDAVDENCDGRSKADAIVALEPGDYPEGVSIYRDIQSAIDDAEDGWLILVYPGVYPGNLELREGANVTLLGMTDLGEVIIEPPPPSSEEPDQKASSSKGLPRGGPLRREDPQGKDPRALIVIEGAHQHLESLTLRGAAAHSFVIEGGSPTLRRVTVQAGGDTGIVLRESDATLDEVAVSGCFGDLGGGIAIYGGEPTLQRVTLKDNRASWGGGVYLDRSEATVIHSLVEGNQADYGGGLCAIFGRLKVNNTRFVDNTYYFKGGGVYLEEARGDMTHVVIRGNQAEPWGAATGGGLYVEGQSLDISNAIISGNKADGAGGLYVNHAEVVAENIAVNSNSATIEGGGGLIRDGASSLSMTNSIVAFNAAPLGYNMSVYGDLHLAHSCHYGQWAGDSIVGAEVPADGDVWFGDPGYLNDGSDGVWADDDYHLKDVSLSMDGGDPQIRDPDGSPSDIGPFGGPEADGFDLDGDGAMDWWDPTLGFSQVRHDCDDEDPLLWPGQGC